MDVPFTPIEDIEKKIKETDKEQNKSESFLNNITNSMYTILMYIVYAFAAVGVFFAGKYGWNYWQNKKKNNNSMTDNSNNILEI